MTAGDMVTAHGQANVDAFRRARGTLATNGGLATFDNSFTDRLGLSSSPAPTVPGWSELYGNNDTLVMLDIIATATGGSR